jgi:hypothetical protein
VVGLSYASAKATLPATVTIPAGATSATFIATTVFTSIDVNLNVVATTNSQTVTTPFTINSSNVLTVEFSSGSSVVGGGFLQGQVNLPQPAPAGGTTIMLSSNNSIGTVPASVLMPAGATTVYFKVTTTAVSVNTIVKITGTLGNATSSASITVTP